MGLKRPPAAAELRPSMACALRYLSPQGPIHGAAGSGIHAAGAPSMGPAGGHPCGGEAAGCASKPRRRRLPPARRPPAYFKPFPRRGAPPRRPAALQACIAAAIHGVHRGRPWPRGKQAGERQRTRAHHDKKLGRSHFPPRLAPFYCEGDPRRKMGTRGRAAQTSELHRTLDALAQNPHHEPRSLLSTGRARTPKRTRPIFTSGPGSTVRWHSSNRNS